MTTDTARISTIRLQGGRGIITGEIVHSNPNYTFVVKADGSEGVVPAHLIAGVHHHQGTYATRCEAIQREIVDVIENTPYDTDDEHAIERIADDVLGDKATRFARVVDDEAFWASVIDNVS